MRPVKLANTPPPGICKSIQIPIFLSKSISKLRARNIFGKVEETVENGSSDDLKIITINVEEQATGEISAGAGIGTDGGAFDFSIKENNLKYYPEIEACV